MKVVVILTVLVALGLAVVLSPSVTGVVGLASAAQEDSDAVVTVTRVVDGDTIDISPAVDGKNEYV